MKVSISLYRKTFVFDVPQDKFTPCYYPMTERVELRIGTTTYKPAYVVDEYGTIDTEIKDVILELPARVS
jgi:hypothetical protein